jgi:hypothetical protein
MSEPRLLDAAEALGATSGGPRTTSFGHVIHLIPHPALRKRSGGQLADLAFSALVYPTIL